MQYALQIQEILLNLLGHCCPPSRNKPGSDIPALARTCRAFKELVLDLLWEPLTDLSPLARCLPESNLFIIANGKDMLGGFKCLVSLSPINRLFPNVLQSIIRLEEWGILRGYSHRI